MEVAINMKTAAMVWWAFMWRCVVFCFGAAVIVGFVIGLVAGIAGIDTDQHEGVLGLIGAIIGMIVSIKIIYHLMDKGFGRYRLQVKLRES